MLDIVAILAPSETVVDAFSNGESVLLKDVNSDIDSDRYEEVVLQKSTDCVVLPKLVVTVLESTLLLKEIALLIGSAVEVLISASDDTIRDEVLAGSPSDTMEDVRLRALDKSLIEDGA